MMLHHALLPHRVQHAAAAALDRAPNQPFPPVSEAHVQFPGYVGPRQTSNLSPRAHVRSVARDAQADTPAPRSLSPPPLKTPPLGALPYSPVLARRLPCSAGSNPWHS